jgi:hypothetical protein
MTLTNWISKKVFFNMIILISSGRKNNSILFFIFCRSYHSNQAILFFLKVIFSFESKFFSYRIAQLPSFLFFTKFHPIYMHNFFLKIFYVIFFKDVIGKLHVSSLDYLFFKQKLILNTKNQFDVLISSESFNLCNISDSFLLASLFYESKIMIISTDFKSIKCIDRLNGNQLSYPRGIAFDGLNSIIICDSVNNRLLVSDVQMTNIQIVGTRGKRLNEFLCPFDAYFDSNKKFVYICDTGRVVLKINNYSLDIP